MQRCPYCNSDNRKFIENKDTPSGNKDIFKCEDCGEYSQDYFIHEYSHTEKGKD